MISHLNFPTVLEQKTFSQISYPNHSLDCVAALVTGRCPFGLVDVFGHQPHPLLGVLDQLEDHAQLGLFRIDFFVLLYHVLVQLRKTAAKHRADVRTGVAEVGGDGGGAAIVQVVVGRVRVEPVKLRVHHVGPVGGGVRAEGNGGSGVKVPEILRRKLSLGKVRNFLLLLKRGWTRRACHRLSLFVSRLRQGGEVELLLEGLRGRGLGLLLAAAHPLGVEAVEAAGPDERLHVSRALLVELLGYKWFV